MTNVDVAAAIEQGRLEIALRAEVTQGWLVEQSKDILRRAMTPIEAAMRADERLAAGDMEGEAVWLRIVKAIEKLLSEERPDDAEVH